jgi:hypothetical protein
MAKGNMSPGAKRRVDAEEQETANDAQRWAEASEEEDAKNSSAIEATDVDVTAIHPARSVAPAYKNISTNISLESERWADASESTSFYSSLHYSSTDDNSSDAETDGINATTASPVTRTAPVSVDNTAAISALRDQLTESFRYFPYVDGGRSILDMHAQLQALIKQHTPSAPSLTPTSSSTTPRTTIKTKRRRRREHKWRRALSTK